MSVTKPIPQNFETREVGSILSVIAEVSPDGDMINLNMRPEWVELTGWEAFARVNGAGGKAGEFQIPNFRFQIRKNADGSIQSNPYFRFQIREVNS